MLGKCEQCADTAIGFNDDGEALCSDCLFESTCEELFWRRRMTIYAKCTYAPDGQRMFTKDKAYPVVSTGPFNTLLEFRDNLSRNRVIGRDTLNFITRNDAPNGAMEYALFEEVSS